jgi:hypothetical protein
MQVGATKSGGLARFINHSCEVNVTTATSKGPFPVVRCTARNGLGVANFLAASCLLLGSCFV